MGNKVSVEVPPEDLLNPLTDTPWRTFEYDIWSDEEHDRMLEALKDCFPGSKAVKRANIVLLGPIRHGKSLLVSSFLSLGSTSVLAPAASGQGPTSYTTSLGVYEDRCATIGNVKLYDTMGVEEGENQGFHVHDVTLLLEGHIPKNYEFNPRSPIIPTDKNYTSYPKPGARCHLVVFVIKASVLNGIPRKTVEKLAALKKKIKALGIPRMLILTHADEVCREVASDITKIFLSKAVKRAVSKAAGTFGMTTSYIHPVENYHSLTQTNKRTNVPLLLALRHMLDIADDYFYRSGAAEEPQGWWEWLGSFGCNVL